MQGRNRKQRRFDDRRTKRNRRMICIVGLCVLIALGVLLFAWQRWWRSPDVRDDIRPQDTLPASTEPSDAPDMTQEPERTTEPEATATAQPAAPANPMAIGAAGGLLPVAVADTVQPTATLPLQSTPTGEPDASSEPGGETAQPLQHADRLSDALGEAGLPLSGIKIGIDPGHQAKGNSAQEPVSPGSSETKAKVSSGTQGVATRVPEYVVNLDVSLQLRDALEALGAEVYLTRDTHDIDISNVERAQMMNELGVDLVLRIHCNGSNDRSVKGVSLFVKSTGAGAEESYQACESLLPAMVEATGARSIGIFKRDTYSGMNWSEVPCILVEMGFMSNEEEDRLLNDAEYQQKLVDGMVQGVADYMGRDLDAPASSVEPTASVAPTPSMKPASSLKPDASSVPTPSASPARE